jgi:hypothetical protein
LSRHDAKPDVSEEGSLEYCEQRSISAFHVDAGSGFSLDGALRLNAMRLLVCSDAPARRAAAEIASRGQFRALLELCGQWKLLAGLEARLKSLNVALPEAERAELAQRTQPAFVQTMLCLRAGAIALAALERSSIQCAGFKGLAALAFLYPGPRNRTLQDVDVLIRSRDVEAALRALEEAGFKRSPETPWAEYLAFVRNSPGTAGNEAVSLRDEKGGAVDLHWRLGGLDVETLLASAAPLDFLNRPLPMLSAGHSMLLSVHHALRNDFVPGDIARDVSDFAYWQALLTETGGWQTVGPDAERWGLSAACVALTRIVAELRETPAAEPPLRVSRSQDSAARQLSDFYFHQLSAGPINTDLTYLASPRPVVQVLRGLTSGWKSYRDLMRQSEESNGEASLPLRARLWNLVKASAAVRPGRWRQLRALARAKDKMAGPRLPT